MYMNSIIFDYILNSYGDQHMYWTLYVLNLIFGAISYKLGFARKLSLGKNIIVYILLAIGMMVVTVFSIFQLPITESLIITTIVLAIYRFRLHYQRDKKQENPN
ncbi:MAG TPA: YlaH-like family protein [Cerasibacillus sp.]|uniref:YlaH-like family protein n=1 Tax=Cerasibacillus sp. TaxID=2498711 RepID=UPI002F40D831